LRKAEDRDEIYDDDGSIYGRKVHASLPTSGQARQPPFFARFCRSFAVCNAFI